MVLLGYGHSTGGEWDGFSGFNWGGGGAATAAAYLELRFGGALVSVYTQSYSGLRRAVGVGIDGVRIDRTILRKNLLAINVSNTLAEYGTPTGGRRLRVTIRCEVPCEVNQVLLNGASHTDLTAEALASGLYTTV